MNHTAPRRDFLTATRRDFLTATAAAVTGCALTTNSLPGNETSPAPHSTERLPVRLALNMSTLRGQSLTVAEQVDVAAKAGYDGIEPWIRELREYVDGGGSLRDLRQRIDDAGLTVDGAIGFAPWIVDDEPTRRAGLEEARRDMALVAELGCSHIAAPPVGVRRPVDGQPAGPTLPEIAKRYRALLEVGAQSGVTPMLELWGTSPVLSTLGELAFVATEASHPDACVLPDFYHIYKGGNDFTGLGMIEASRMPVFHINDYPADPARPEIADRDRVFPGDGVCPLPETIAMLLDHGFQGTFSLELFNPQYWERDALQVASEGLLKTRQVIEAAISLRS